MRKAKRYARRKPPVPAHADAPSAAHAGETVQRLTTAPVPADTLAAVPPGAPPRVSFVDCGQRPDIYGWLRLTLGSATHPSPNDRRDPRGLELGAVRTSRVRIRACLSGPQRRARGLSVVRRQVVESSTRHPLQRQVGRRTQGHVRDVDESARHGAQAGTRV